MVWDDRMNRSGDHLQTGSFRRKFGLKKKKKKRNGRAAIAKILRRR